MRTHFSSQQWLASIRKNQIDKVHDDLSYFMWETSTEAICSVGLPTDEDVREWITCLQHREDASSRAVQWCIVDCLDYVNNTKIAFKFLEDELGRS